MNNTGEWTEGHARINALCFLQILFTVQKYFFEIKLQTFPQYSWSVLILQVGCNNLFATISKVLNVHDILTAVGRAWVQSPGRLNKLFQDSCACMHLQETLPVASIICDR